MQTILEGLSFALSKFLGMSPYYDFWLMQQTEKWDQQRENRMTAVNDVR
jgi:hypothetical protein